jgi:hypothetical protein
MSTADQTRSTAESDADGKHEEAKGRADKAYADTIKPKEVAVNKADAAHDVAREDCSKATTSADEAAAVQSQAEKDEAEGTLQATEDFANAEEAARQAKAMADHAAKDAETEAKVTAANALEEALANINNKCDAVSKRLGDEMKLVNDIRNNINNINLPGGGGPTPVPVPICPAISCLRPPTKCPPNSRLGTPKNKDGCPGCSTCIDKDGKSVKVPVCYRSLNACAVPRDRDGENASAPVSDPQAGASLNACAGEALP